MRATETDDEYGNPRPDWDNASRVNVAARVEPAATSELTVDRDSVIADATGFFETDADITAYDRVECDGLTYEVVGTPGLHRAPRGAHHYEVVLTRADP